MILNLKFGHYRSHVTISSEDGSIWIRKTRTISDRNLRDNRAGPSPKGDTREGDSLQIGCLAVAASTHTRACRRCDSGRTRSRCKVREIPKFHGKGVFVGTAVAERSSFIYGPLPLFVSFTLFAGPSRLFLAQHRFFCSFSLCIRLPRY